MPSIGVFNIDDGIYNWGMKSRDVGGIFGRCPWAYTGEVKHTERKRATKS